jgi:hypothetical protein
MVSGLWLAALLCANPVGAADGQEPCAASAVEANKRALYQDSRLIEYVAAHQGISATMFVNLPLTQQTALTDAFVTAESHKRCLGPKFRETAKAAVH